MTRTIATSLALLLTGCVTTTRTTTWHHGESRWERRGYVESVRETVERREGNPAGGAIAGALIGGVLGSAIGGHRHVDRWGRSHHHGSGAGALVGAIGGAAVGAAASGGASEDRWYEVFVRFDDGRLERFTYRGAPAFAVGDEVRLGARGLYRARDA
jgi:outer membrane lipoprotein SlyB